MRSLRFSIAALMATVLYVAVGLASFREAGDLRYGRLLGSAFFTLTVALLGTATLMTVARRDRSRMRWLGFAVFGWAYLQLWYRGEWDQSGEKPVLLHALILYNKTAAFWLGPTQAESNDQWYVFLCVMTVATGLVGAVVGHLIPISDDRKADRA
jgi:hypothetical protein